jgi:hypothetical protein
VFQTPEKLSDALKRPDIEIAAPPSISAASGRMNAHGIAVFYGATDPSIALAEVRPPVGSKVLVGGFKILTPLQLLDIEALRSVYAEGSIFDPDYLRRLKRAKFLRWLSSQITQPVMPVDEPFGYLSTQAMADFLAAHADPPLDGIVYPSVQGSEGKPNVVLFHKAARVERLAIPDNIEFSVELSLSTEEADIPHYSVCETVDDETVKEVVMTDPVQPPQDDDKRQPTLKLEMSSLQVHHVLAVHFKTENHSISRHRFMRSGNESERYKAVEENVDF